MPIVGIFSYFAQIDTDGSGTLDLQEVTGNYLLTDSDEISRPRFQIWLLGYLEKRTKFC